MNIPTSKNTSIIDNSKKVTFQDENNPLLKNTSEDGSDELCMVCHRKKYKYTCSDCGKKKYCSMKCRTKDFFLKFHWIICDMEFATI